MKTSEATENRSLVKKLAVVMSQVGYIPKNGYNAFHKYKYATESDVADKVRDLLAEQNTMMMPSVLEHTVREITTRKGNTEYVNCVLMEFVFIDGDSGEQIAIRMVGEGQDASDKGYYKAITGATKYALMKAFMIPTGDDPEMDQEGKANGKPTQTHPPAQKAPAKDTGGMATEKQVKAIFTIGDKKGLDKDTIKGIIFDLTGAGSSKDLSKSDASTVIEHLNGLEVAS